MAEAKIGLRFSADLVQQLITEDFWVVCSLKGTSGALAW